MGHINMEKLKTRDLDLHFSNIDEKLHMPRE